MTDIQRRGHVTRSLLSAYLQQKRNWNLNKRGGSNPQHKQQWLKINYHFLSEDPAQALQTGTGGAQVMPTVQINTEKKMAPWAGSRTPNLRQGAERRKKQLVHDQEYILACLPIDAVSEPEQHSQACTFLAQWIQEARKWLWDLCVLQNFLLTYF